MQSYKLIFVQANTSQEYLLPKCLNMLPTFTNQWLLKFFRREFEMFVDPVIYSCGETGTASEYKHVFI
jgi:hypothetical protein